MEEMTLSQLKAAVRNFVEEFSVTSIAVLYGVTDGKAVGTHVEHAFHEFLKNRYSYEPGSSASGLDFPDLRIDLKVTSIRQPQSSSPFRSASEKVYGLGYGLIVFVYEKVDDHDSRTAQLSIRHAIFVTSERTGDYQTTYGLKEILRRNGNKDDIVAFLHERNLPLDDIGRDVLAERIFLEPPEVGYLTLSNALQWRLQYRRVIQNASSGGTEGVEDLLV
jgi:hypothetical protein